MNMQKFTTINYGWQFLNLPNLNIFLGNNLYLAIDLFWDSIFNNLEIYPTPAKRVEVILRVKTSDGEYVTIVPLQIIDESNKTSFTLVLENYVYLIKNYNSLDVKNVIFQYRFLEKDSKKKVDLLKNISISSYYFSTYNFPLTTDLNHWGKISNIGKELLIRSDKYESEIKVSVDKDKQTYEFILDNKIILKVVDFFGSSHNSFIRTIHNQIFIVNKGKVSYYFFVKFIIKVISYFYKAKIFITNFLNFSSTILFKVFITAYLIFSIFIYLAVLATIIWIFIYLLT